MKSIAIAALMSSAMGVKFANIENAFNLAQVESQFKFDATTGEIAQCSYLSNDVVQLGRTLGITAGNTWGKCVREVA